VFEEEPKIHPGLLECENAVLLPHVGTGTIETQVSRCCGDRG
jgi:glyoxylate reductase